MQTILLRRAGGILLLFLGLCAGSGRPAGAGVLPLGDDETVEVAFSPGFAFPLFGTHYTSVHVNSNGSLTFGRGDRSSLASEAAFLAGPPRLAGLWTDLDPTQGGTVSTASSPSSFTATWNRVPVFGEPEGNTFSIVLHPDGSFEIVYGDLAAGEGVAGYSGGEPLEAAGTPPVDLSGETQPLGNGSRPAVHQVFDAASPPDLQGRTLAFRATWDWYRAYASDTSLGDLRNINGWTGASRPVGPLGQPTVEGLAFAPDGTLYGVDMSRFPASAVLLRIDPSTGAATEIGPLGFSVVRSLAAAPGGTLYGVEMDPDLEETNLLVINRTTGVASVLAPLTSTDISAMAFTHDGTLYAVDGDRERLVEIDPANGAERPVGPLGLDGVTGLAAASDGRLLAVRQELVVGEGFFSFLLEVDPATGHASEIGPSGPGAFGGLAARCERTNGSVELCDGLDNDCGGGVDEAFPDLGLPCTNGLGRCARDGRVTCTLDGLAALCDAVPGEPADEICNGLDDDCNDIVEDDLDVDGDTLSLCDGDCDDGAPGSLYPPVEVAGLLFEQGLISWEDQRALSGQGTRYDVLVALSAGLDDLECLAGDLADPLLADTLPPPGPPSILYYQVRARNACGEGGFGTDSEGAPRPPAGDCP